MILRACLPQAVQQPGHADWMVEGDVGGRITGKQRPDPLRPASGKPLDLSALLIPPHLGDGLDLCYVKDTGRAIALIQLAGHLQHRTYNIASGRVTTNAEVIAAIREAVPEAELGLPAGARRPGAALDITRLRQDTGFEPEYGTVRAAAGYIAWLRAGNER